MTTSKAVNSQAFGFMSYVQGGVDPRTGQYTVSIDLPEVKNNWLSGPAFPLNLTFNPINTLDSGFGVGWNLNLSQFTPHDSILALSTGETFKVTGSGATPDIREKKLDTFHFENLGSERYRVLHKSGMVEVLQVGGSQNDRVGLPVSITAPTGHSLTLAYASFRGGQRLQSISDAQGELLRINRHTGDEWVEILVRPDAGPGGAALARYEMKLNASGWVTEIILPTADKGSWRFGYGNGPIRNILCLHEVKNPAGGRETIEYADTGHPYPGGVTRPNLPRVTRHRNYPDFGLDTADDTMVEMVFSYTAHNFLGAGATVSWEEGMDPLYKLSASYEYGSTASLMVGGSAVRQVERRYNRFHLLTEEVTTQEHCVMRVTTQYYAEDVAFERQLPQFQMPKAVTTSWELDNDASQYRAETEFSAYDENGNQTERVEPNGIKTVYTYYSKNGEDGCPPDRFTRRLKDTTVFPSPQGEPGAPTLRTRRRYADHPPLINSGMEAWLAIDSETLVQVEGAQETTLQQTQLEYYELPGDAFLHGRLLNQRIMLNGTTSTYRYEYDRLASVLAGETVLETRELFTGFDGIEKTMSRQDSLITGETVLSNDLDGVQLLRQYDVLGRVIKETVSPASPDARAERIFTYMLANADGQKASQSMTDVKGVTTYSHFDGLGRVVYQERAEKAKAPRQVLTAAYDKLDNLIEEVHYDWLDDNPMPLRQGFEYDAWGFAHRVTQADGVVSRYLWSPFGRKGPTEHRWLETPDTETAMLISNLTAGEYNEFGKLDRSQRFDAQPLIERCHEQPERPVAEHLRQLLETSGLPVVGAVEYTYDGKSNCVRQKELTDGQERTTHFAYDAHDRMKTTTLPDNTLINRTFAAHCIDEQITRLAVKANAKPEVELGTQSFDSLQRLTERRVGPMANPRIEAFRYTGGQMQPNQRITPANDIFDYEYKPELTQQPLAIITSKDESATYVYDLKTGAITRAQNTHGQREYRYADTGELEYESWTDTDGTRMETTYRTSLHGRQMLRSHTDGLDTRYTYDDAGRAETVSQGALQAEFAYDTLGRLHRTTTRSPQSTLTADVKYDTLGREIERTLAFNDQPPRVITQAWQDDNHLKERHVFLDGQNLLHEEFAYDARSRLIQHKCTGSTLPKDAYGNAIASQVFRFDELDNLLRVTTQFADNLTDVAAFTYDADDPCRLERITHTYTSGGYPALLEFSYDANGHMLNDDQNRQLVYDNHGRLVAVKDAQGQTLLSYRYDGHNHLVGVRRGNEQETLRFYQGYTLSHTLQNGTGTQYLFHDERPLGQQSISDHDQAVLLMTDASPNVIGECSQSQVRTAVYSAYGVRSSDDELQSLLAFNGEVCEDENNWYLLGRGYRVYNPNLMRFHSPDSYSPFGEGGTNPYAYCLGNPVALRDPTGHRVRGSRPDNPDYIDPIEQPKQKFSFWEKMGFWVAAAVTLVLAAAAVVATGGGAAAVVGLVIVGIGAVVMSVGAATNNMNMVSIGGILLAIGGLISGASYIKFKFPGAGAGAGAGAGVGATAGVGTTVASVSKGSMGYASQVKLPRVNTPMNNAKAQPNHAIRNIEPVAQNSNQTSKFGLGSAQAYPGDDPTIDYSDTDISRRNSITGNEGVGGKDSNTSSHVPGPPAREISNAIAGTLNTLQRKQKERNTILTNGVWS
ncbi:RHS repeat-associated core domain-containing protein [Pseudomonas sp. RGM2987]|uniref:RHS repeat domain-containing protein n=1 Tax=Pseudomonas sp. RGM2987 TaxID=2930090 RepID=UPI001FD6F762|nr:RHS repeat-associated core domain-containing protein [Pseudomonas sp. RGM2987]MCJ8205290.1 sugar-binding protein [Pseudomonas sp. RGM2987]